MVNDPIGPLSGEHNIDNYPMDRLQDLVHVAQSTQLLKLAYWTNYKSYLETIQSNHLNYNSTLSPSYK